MIVTFQGHRIASAEGDQVQYKIVNVKHPGMFWDLAANAWVAGDGSAFRSRHQAVKAVESAAIPDAQVRRFS
jgi:hypothetical protein